MLEKVVSNDKFDIFEDRSIHIKCSMVELAEYLISIEKGEENGSRNKKRT